MLRRFSALTIISGLFGMMLTGCNSSEKLGHAAVPTSPTPTLTTSPSPVAPSPSVSLLPSPSPSQSSEPTPSPTVVPSPSPKATVTPQSSAKVAATDDRKAHSWYFMKHGTGKVPDFPAETKKFKPTDKAVWVSTGKKVYLTFDTGGPMGDTEKLLKTLKDNDVKASFFIAGYNMKAHPDFLKQLVEDGHLVADHTMTHRDLTTLSDDEVKKEINDFAAMYKEITGQNQPMYFRFPFGTYSYHLLSMVSEMGYTSVFWSTAYRDWEPRENGADDAFNDVMSMLHDGNIILMHQGSEENIDALDRIIKEIKKKGYSFSTVADF